MSGSASDLFAGGLRSTTSILNYCSSGGVNVTDLPASSNNNAKEVLSGALTAATLATALSVTGAGEIGYLAVYSKDGTARAVRIKVTVDGNATAVFDATSSSFSSTGRGLLVVGNLPSSPPVALGAVIPLRWNASLLVEIASSLTETDKIAIAYSMNKV